MLLCHIPSAMKQKKETLVQPVKRSQTDKKNFLMAAKHEIYVYILYVYVPTLCMYAGKLCINLGIHCNSKSLFPKLNFKYIC